MNHGQSDWKNLLLGSTLVHVLALPSLFSPRSSSVSSSSPVLLDTGEAWAQLWKQR